MSNNRMQISTHIPECFEEEGISKIEIINGHTIHPHVHLRGNQGRGLFLTYGRYLKCVELNKLLSLAEYEAILESETNKAKAQETEPPPKKIDAKESNNLKWINRHTCLCWTQAGYKAALRHHSGGRIDHKPPGFPKRYPALVTLRGDYDCTEVQVFYMEDLENILEINKEHFEKLKGDSTCLMKAA